MAGGSAAVYSGAEFEIEFDLKNILDPYYDIAPGTGRATSKSNGMEVGIYGNQWDVHSKVFDRLGVDMRLTTGIARKPDDFFLNFNDGVLYIIEKKNQRTEGSVDEKIEAGPMRRVEYREAVNSMYQNELCDKKIGVAIAYVLSDHFAAPKYDFILRMLWQEYGIPCGINEFPLSFVGLGNDGLIPFADFKGTERQPEPLLRFDSNW